MQRIYWMRPRVVVVVASLGLIASAGCKNSDDGNEGAELGTDSGETADGTGDESGDTGDGLSLWEFEPLYGVPNLDDDDQNGKSDWLELVFEEDDEVGTLVIPETAYMPGDSVRLSLSGGLDTFRLWHNGKHVLGSGAAEPLTEYAINGPSGDIELRYEFGDFLKYADLTLERLDADGVVTATATIEAVSSPLMMNHHLQPAEHLWIIQTGDNQAYISDYKDALGDDVTAVPGGPYQNDRWIQDEIEFGYSTAPGGKRFDNVIDSIRNRGLAPFASDFFSGPDWYIGMWGNPPQATTFDAFGNLEASPPVEGYPFGRIYYGREGNNGLNTILGDFLADQVVQEPFQIPTDWLCVGHIDEVSTFIADASSAKGFKLLLADTISAYELFDGLDPSWEMTRYGGSYGYATVGELVADSTLRAHNQDFQTNNLDLTRARFKQELGLTDADIIEIPTIFERVGGCGGRAAALTPGAVNLIVATVDGNGETILAVPDPFARPGNLGPADDPVAQDFVQRMPAGVSVAFIDNWYSYHMLLGEVHCGTNVTRTPLEDWTTAGAALLGLEGGN